ncbi:polysaccharide biosynthesis protein [Anaerobaca lacustris]|uniref:Nucleoside-diphosphate sugar epimerase/dehydratase n=1 Tax=Anaerobaca lacustris TaxID=3044600 RepID=A0AAW6TZM7_9BACT|nr:nucleoside-diphosphate sugar epimerase/dehydratase [Sedimentisphaerales bacterium M17dextr]
MQPEHMPEPWKDTHAEAPEDTLSGSTAPSPGLFLAIRKPLIILAHIGAFAMSLIFAFLVASNMQFSRHWLVEQYPFFLLFSLMVKLPVFGLFKQYRPWWRYVSISDLLGILRAALVSTLIIVTIWFAVMLQIPAVRKALPPGIAAVSQGVFMADLFGTILLPAGLRMLIRLYHEEFRTTEGGLLKRFLIVGAGNAGEGLLREILRMRIVRYDVIGFIDDDPAKQGTSIHGIAVLGTVDQLPRICRERNIEEIAIAMPSATHQQLRRVIQLCEGAKVRFRTVPSITDIASGKLRVSQIRDVDINDLLGRRAVQLDLDSIEAFARDKTILVTGAGGSIGSEMCRQICQFGPERLLLVEQAENALFYVERDLRKRFAAVTIEPIVCNITDRSRVEDIFDRYRPAVVIHAAAHKHVPLMELNAGEAVKNNIAGTQVVADASDRHGVARFVMISTDKAVNPTSIMGSSKRIAEMYVQDLSRTSETHFVTVRFGNVLASEGSVVPIFRKQIAEGGPVTVTHPEMKRYFMTIPEASQLVLQAATMGKGGEIFVLDMGEPVKIVDLAKELITLSGFRPGQDIEIVFTGLRPGEKLFEELRIEGEDMQRTRHPKIRIWRNKPMDRDRLRAGIDHLVELARRPDAEPQAIVAAVKDLVPEYAIPAGAGWIG